MCLKGVWVMGWGRRCSVWALSCEQRTAGEPWRWEKSHPGDRRCKVGRFWESETSGA